MAEATTQTAAPTVNTGRLKYADPKDLPSYPSSGLKPDGAAASAAATLGWHNPKTVELWKPDKLSSASAAAVLAKDYKMAPQWTPTANSDGHQAALLAVGSASSALKHSRSTSKDQHEGWGSSAATHAFHASRPTSLQPSDLTHGSTAATQAFKADRSESVRKSNAIPSPTPQGDRSLLAAKGAMASNRPRATSTPSARPTSVQLQSHAASSALNGATTAHRASMQAKSPVGDAGAVPITTMTRNMFTSHPMVKPEVDEQQNNERLHNTAVEMAKKMYNQQQKMAEQARANGEDPDKPTGPAYLNLQDAAYKQAQERLAKLHDEHAQNRELKEYYGQGQAPRRRFTVSSRLRRRNSDDDVFNDREESEKIRQQMSMFSTKLSEVDKTKRQTDRDNLLAAAQRNVKARLHGMDEKVYNDTGKVNPSLLSDWEAKAHQAAQLRHDTRSENKGKTDLGGGMYMDQEQIDAIAAKRMQPVLDDINEKAEKERERQAVLKMEEEARKAEIEREKERDREAKALLKRVREEDKQDAKAKRQQEKAEEKARKDQEKAEKAEQKRLAKEEKRRSKHDSTMANSDAHDDATSPVASGAAGEAESPERVENEEHAVAASPVVSSVASPLAAPVTEETAAPIADEPAVHTEPQQAEEGSPRKSGVKGWIKNRLSRGKSIGNRGDVEITEKTEKSEKRKSFFRGGGAMLKKNSQQNASQTSLENPNESLRDVALAGKSEEPEARDEAAGPSIRRDSHGVSLVSSNDEDEDTRSRKSRQAAIDSLPPPKLLGESVPRSSISPSRDSRFREEI